MIYLDNGATTMMDPEIVKAMTPYFSEKYGNASSTHMMGIWARQAVDESRHAIASSIGAKDDEIIFTSGGTESNNLAIKGIAFANKDKGKHIIITKIEHDCVLNACKWLETQGFKITYLNVDKEGFVNPKELEKAINLLFENVPCIKIDEYYIYALSNLCKKVMLERRQLDE